MKSLKPGIKIALSVLLVISVGCASNGSVSTPDEDIKKTENYSANYWTLEDFLRRTSGVQLQGSGTNIQVTIRGPNSINNVDNPPLYIVDGQKAGRNFARVSSMFSRGEISSVEVLPPGASNMYGMEGNYGVIKIESQNAAN